MTTQLSKRHTHLPFDVLCAIFSYYAEDEVPKFPTETLLLVCRFWSWAAIEHRQIWSKFNIYLDSLRNAQYWARQILRRLERSGSNSLIYLKVRQLRFENVTSQMIRIMSSIAGSGGALCARWRVIDLDLKYVYFGHDTPVFSYPTPLLTSLTLRGVKLRRYYLRKVPFFPSTSSLRTVTIVGCRTPAIPDIGNATFIQLANCTIRGSQDSPIGFLPLGHAKQLQHLSLDLLTGFRLPDDLPSLIFLHLGSRKIPDNIRDVATPSLLELSLNFRIDNVLALLENKGIPFHQLQALVLICDEFEKYSSITTDDKIRVLDTCRGLLLACSHIERITCDDFMIGIILKLLRDDCLGDGLLTKQLIRISDTQHTRDLAVGREERLVSILAFCDDIGEQWIKED